MAAHLRIVCSSASRNGKTLLARMHADCLSLGGSLYGFDTDAPNGGLARYMPGRSEVIALSRTMDQVRLFDTILANPDVNFVVDLQARWLETFFGILHDVEFDVAAAEAGFTIDVLCMIDRSASSVTGAAKVAARLTQARLTLVRNEAIGNLLHVPSIAEQYLDIPRHAELVMPRLGPAALALVEDPRFSFADFLATSGRDVPLEPRFEILGFLEALYDQTAGGVLGLEPIE